MFRRNKTFAEISEVYDNQLFSKIIRNPWHILNQLLPSVSAAAENYRYNLRPRKHNRLLLERATRLSDANFIYRILYTDIYYCAAKKTIVQVAVCQPFL